MSASHSSRGQRIVSLAPSVTSILITLGARRELVGVSKWCRNVANVRKLPAVGDCWALNIEEVMRLRPTLLIGSVPFKTETVGRILEQPVPFLASNPRSLSDIDSEIRMLGRLVGRDSGAEELIRRMRDIYKMVARKAAQAHSRPKVYCEAWPNPRITSPPWVAELVEIAGGNMILSAGERVTDNAVAKAQPEVIILAWTATRDRARAETTYAVPSWWNVPAIRQRRVVVIRDELLNTPGPPLTEGAVALLKAIHPELKLGEKA